MIKFPLDVNVHDYSRSRLVRFYEPILLLDFVRNQNMMLDLLDFPNAKVSNLNIWVSIEDSYISQDSSLYRAMKSSDTEEIFCILEESFCNRTLYSAFLRLDGLWGEELFCSISLNKEGSDPAIGISHVKTIGSDASQDLLDDITFVCLDFPEGWTVGDLLEHVTSKHTRGEIQIQRNSGIPVKTLKYHFSDLQEEDVSPALLHAPLLDVKANGRGEVVKWIATVDRKKLS